MPRVRKLSYKFPLGCPLEPELDRYGLLEKSKHRVRHNYWRCRVCNKSFKTEEFIDNHLLSRHPEVLPSNRQVGAHLRRGGAAMQRRADVCVAPQHGVPGTPLRPAALRPRGTRRLRDFPHRHPSPCQVSTGSLPCCAVPHRSQHGALPPPPLLADVRSGRRRSGRGSARG